LSPLGLNGFKGFGQTSFGDFVSQRLSKDLLRYQENVKTMLNADGQNITD